MQTQCLIKYDEVYRGAKLEVYMCRIARIATPSAAFQAILSLLG